MSDNDRFPPVSAAEIDSDTPIRHLHQILGSSDHLERLMLDRIDEARSAYHSLLEDRDRELAMRAAAKRELDRRYAADELTETGAQQINVGVPLKADRYFPDDMRPLGLDAGVWRIIGDTILFSDISIGADGDQQFLTWECPVRFLHGDVS